MKSRPVSATLESDLRAAVRRHGVVAWLDADGHYTPFVDRLLAARASPSSAEATGAFVLLAYRGSHLALMLQAEGLASGVERTPLVIHLPRFTEDRVRSSPVYELYAAGVRYRKGLDTLVTEAAAGRVRPDVIAAFLAEPQLSLERADTWLAALLDERAGGLAAQLQAMSLPALVDDLLTAGFVAGRLFPQGRAASPDLDVLWEHLAVRTGLTAAWREHALSTRTLHAEDAAFAVSSWALCVEYVFDLGRPAVGARLQAVVGLPPAVVAACCTLAAHLRERHARAYARWADETEAWLADEIAIAKPRDLGKIDTLRFEEDLVLRGALDAMASEPEDWRQVLTWADARLAGVSFWVRQDDARLAAWQLVASAARLGQAMQDAGPQLSGRGLTGALDRYVTHGAAVDQAHRHLEQVRAARSHMPLPERDAVRAALADVREAWRTWADAWSRDFNALCRRDGFLPSPHLQQRTLFEDVVRPMTLEPGITAVFLVDALRYEMAEELYRTLAETPATAVQLKARLAELPTVTEVGMNVLAPVAGAGGRLRAAIGDGRMLGFSTGEFRVHDRETRRRAMADRVGGATCPLLTLEEVLGREMPSLKQAVSRAKLVVVHSQEIDTAGENGVGPNVFERVLQRLRAAWQLLREAGVRRFVITADHGYLLLDETARETAQAHGRKVDPKRRHAFAPVPADHTGEARVPLAELGYDGVAGHIVFPETTAIFDTGRRELSFVHGGNSLQERVIPVLTLVHRAAIGGDAQRYAIRAKAKDGVAGMCCLEAWVESVAQGALAFGGTREVELGLSVTEPGVRVEVCDVRGAPGTARREAGAIRVQVGASFEVFFRLIGPTESRVRLTVEHAGAEAVVESCTLEERFVVSLLPGRRPEPEDSQSQKIVLHPAVTEGSPRPDTTSGPGAPRDSDWLALLPDGGPRRLFAHLAEHGAVTEAEAHGMFPSPRALRAFAIEFEKLAAKAPFGVHIETVGGVKRYVREGGSR